MSRIRMTKATGVTGADWPRHPGRVLAVESMTAALAAIGGGLLVAAPDGSLLRADPQALAGSPFSSWRVPGLFLLTIVGSGYAILAATTAARWRWARPLTAIAGAGLVAFEAFEVAWLGPQPLEAVFAAIGGYLLFVATRDQPVALMARRRCRPKA